MFRMILTLILSEFKDLLTAEVETGSTLILKYTINTESYMTWRYKLDNSSISFGIKRKKASQNLTSRSCW